MFACVGMNSPHVSPLFYLRCLFLLLKVCRKNIHAEYSSVIPSNLTSVNNSENVHIIKEELSEYQIKKHNILLETDNFKTLCLHSTVFVDKSEMINEYLERGGLVLVITRPRKWGKSVILSMFKCFFEIEVDNRGIPLEEQNRTNSVLFTGGNIILPCGTTKKLNSLIIARFMYAMDYLGKNPVIMLSFKDVKGRTYEEYKKKILQITKNLYSSYPYLNQSREANGSDLMLKTNEVNQDNNTVSETILINSIYFLSKLLYKHFKKYVYIFFDDYESPIVNAYLEFGHKSGDFAKVEELTYQIIKKALKDNQYLERGIMSGTYHLGWVNEIFTLSSVRHTTIIDTTFSKFYGFSKEEVDSILQKIPMKTLPDKIKDWYNGYNFEGLMIYNPWSTLHCLSNGGKFASYWKDILNTSSDLMARLYFSDNTQEYLHQLLQGKVITRKNINKPINLANIENSFHRVLLFGGYMNSVSACCESRCYIHPWNLSIPNREVRDILAEGVSKWVAHKLSIDVSDYLNFTNLLTNLQIDDFTGMFQKYLLNSSVPKAASEQQHFYHLLLSGMMSGLASTYKVESSRKPGKKSREYILTPHPDLGNNVIIIEYEIIKASKKLKSTVENGFKRLITKQTINKIKYHKYVNQTINIYMAFSKKRIALKYQISGVG